MGAGIAAESAHPCEPLWSLSRVQNEASRTRKKRKISPAASGRLTGAADEQGLAEAQHSGQQEPQATVHGPLWPPAGSRVSPGRVVHALVCWAKPDRNRGKHSEEQNIQTNTEKVRFTKAECREVKEEI